MKRTLHKALSMLLIAAMVLNMGLSPVLAEGVAIGAPGLSDCHTKHDSECGYSETIKMGGCTHEHTKECYSKELTCVLVEGQAPEIGTDSNATADESHSHGEECYSQIDNCRHKHDETCGYTETETVTPCTHTCEVCKPVDSGKPQEKVCTCEPALGASDVGHGEDCPFYTAPECTCPLADSSELVHGKDCPLYVAPELSKAVKALIAMVDALPNADAITDENREAATLAFDAAALAYEELTDADKAVFDATEQYTKLMALRDVLYGIATMAGPVTLDISSGQGPINIDKNGYSIDGGALVNHKGAYIITGTAHNADEYKGMSYLTVHGDGTYDITLRDLTIKSGKEKSCAFTIMSKATVNLTLEGNNTLHSASGLGVKSELHSDNNSGEYRQTQR